MSFPRPLTEAPRVAMLGPHIVGVDRAGHVAVWRPRGETMVFLRSWRSGDSPSSGTSAIVEAVGGGFSVSSAWAITAWQIDGTLRQGWRSPSQLLCVRPHADGVLVGDIAGDLRVLDAALTETRCEHAGDRVWSVATRASELLVGSSDAVTWRSETGTIVAWVGRLAVDVAFTGPESCVAQLLGSRLVAIDLASATVTALGRGEILWRSDDDVFWYEEAGARIVFASAQGGRRERTCVSCGLASRPLAAVAHAGRLFAHDGLGVASVDFETDAAPSFGSVEGSAILAMAPVSAHRVVVMLEGGEVRFLDLDAP